MPVPSPSQFLRSRSRRSVGVLGALLAVTAVVAVAGIPTTAQAAPVTITNRTQFQDTSGAVIHAHGGGIIKVGDYYYWFGESRNADFTFRAVTAYRSTDLKTWEFRGNVLTQCHLA